MKIYTPKKWDLAGLEGISDATLEMHFGLYEGYVKNTNLLNEMLGGIRAAGEAAKDANPAYAELVRRLGFEYNGMRLHEYYFDNMTKALAETRRPANCTTRSARRTAGSTNGRRTSPRSAACAASDGRSPIATRRTGR